MAPSKTRRNGLLSFLLLATLALPAFAQDEATQLGSGTDGNGATIGEPIAEPSDKVEFGVPLPEDGPAYPISKFHLQYVTDNPDHPDLEEIRQHRFIIGLSDEGYVAPRPTVKIVILRIADVDELPVEQYHASAIQHILEEIRDQLIKKSLLGLYVAPDPFQLTETGEDLRGDGETDLRIVIQTGIITELRSLASGDRIPDEERINHPLHKRIRDESPIQPYWGLDVQRKDLLRKDRLDRYIFHKSRHPGRRVDVAVSPAMEPGGGALDYLIQENRPLILYAQVSNTGTRSTERVRERLGLVHTQLTNADDIFEFAYVTANFDDTNTVLATYERPFANDRIRWRVSGLWSEFTASDVGFFEDDFTGESWSLGADIIANVYQDREFFVDIVGGARLIEPEVFNPLIGTGEEMFLLPHVGVRFDRTVETMSTTGLARLEFQVGDITDVDDTQLTRLGRTSPDRDWVVLQWNLNHSFYLEPLLNRRAWEDPTTPESSTLAHEIAASFRGQYAFDNRLIPQVEQAIGGFRTVRGYPESVTAGDTALIASLEYRYHLPRALEVQPEPRELFGEPFRVAPQYVYGHPDWDLVLKGFVDVGRTYISDQLSFEREDTLLGVGVGMELRIKRNFRVELDWGHVIEPIDELNVHGGSNRVHVSATIQF